MFKFKYEENKFLVINNKFIDEIQYAEESSTRRTIKIFKQKLNKLIGMGVIPLDNKYYVCNQDEPYAEDVLNVIKKGEDYKTHGIVEEYLVRYSIEENNFKIANALLDKIISSEIVVPVSVLMTKNLEERCDVLFNYILDIQVKADKIKALIGGIKDET